MHAQEVAILDRRLKDDPRGVPHPYQTDELQAVCAQSTDETARKIASSLLRQRGEEPPEPVARREHDRSGPPAISANETIARDRESQRQREIAYARAVLEREREGEAS